MARRDETAEALLAAGRRARRRAAGACRCPTPIANGSSPTSPTSATPTPTATPGRASPGCSSTSFVGEGPSTGRTSIRSPGGPPASRAGPRAATRWAARGVAHAAANGSAEPADNRSPILSTPSRGPGVESRRHHVDPRVNPPLPTYRRTRRTRFLRLTGPAPVPRPASALPLRGDLAHIGLAGPLLRAALRGAAAPAGAWPAARRCMAAPGDGRRGAVLADGARRSKCSTVTGDLGLGLPRARRAGRLRRASIGWRDYRP